MHYFSLITYEYVPKNKLHKAVLDLLKENDRMIILKADVIKFQGKITDRIEELNKEHPRCEPIKPYFWKPRDGDDDYCFSPQAMCVFTLKASKN